MTAFLIAVRLWLTVPGCLVETDPISCGLPLSSAVSLWLTE
jgi:hypothetical protein